MSIPMAATIPKPGRNNRIVLGIMVVIGVIVSRVVDPDHNSRPGPRPQEALKERVLSL